MTLRTLKPSLALGYFSFRPKLILLAILLLAFALRVARLDFQPLWWDEGYSLFFATRDFATMLDRTALDIHPPLYYALLQLWMLFAGKGDIAVRFFSVAIGSAAIPLLYALARRLFNQPTALITAFLLAIAPFHVYYSQEVRMYELVTILCLASVYLFVMLLETSHNRSKNSVFAVVYILVTTAALYTQYFAAFVLAFEILIALILTIRKQSRFTLHTLRSVLFAWVSIALLYLPWVIYAGTKLYAYVTFKVGHEAYPQQDPLSFLAQHLVAFSIGHLSTIPLFGWSTILFVLLSTLGIYSLRRGVTASPRLPLPSFPALLTTQYLLVPLALGYLVSLVYPFHPIRYERLLLLASPAFYVLIALGIATIKRRALAFAAVLAILAFSSFSLYDFYRVPRYPDDDYRPLIAQLQALAQPGDNWLAIYPWQIGYLESYYRGAPLNIVETPNDDWVNNPVHLQNGIDTLAQKSPRFWLPGLQTLGHILEDFIDGDFRWRGYSVLDNWYGTTRLQLFLAAQDPPRAGRDLRFDNGVVLSNWGVSTDSVVSGQGIVRFWYWGQNQPAKLRTSLRLVDAKGNTWAQDDREIENRIQKIGFAIPAGTPPGTYDLQLALYRENEAATHPISLATVPVESNLLPNLAAIPHRTTTDFSNGMRLAGYDAANEPLKQGETTGMILFWQATRKQDTDYLVAIQLQDAFRNTLLNTRDTLALGVYSPSRWLVNELVRDPRAFTVGGDIPDGTYALSLSLFDPKTQAPVRTADGRDSVQLLTVQVKGRPHYFGAPTPSHKADARFDDMARLVGYDSIRSGQNLRVVLYWQALGGSQISYKGFVHILDSNGQLIAQRDQIPGAGEFPTTTWVKNEYLVDIYDITLPSDLPDFQIQIGLYDPVTNARLHIFGASGNQLGDNIPLK